MCLLPRTLEFMPGPSSKKAIHLVRRLVEQYGDMKWHLDMLHIVLEWGG